MLIYKIFRPAEWALLQSAGETEGAPIDITDGFVHFSTREQLAETAAKHFADEDDLTLLTVEADGLGTDLKWETSRDGALFPHLYRPLRLADVIEVHRMPLVDGVHRLPDPS